MNLDIDFETSGSMVLECIFVSGSLLVTILTIALALLFEQLFLLSLLAPLFMHVYFLRRNYIRLDLPGLRALGLHAHGLGARNSVRRLSFDGKNWRMVKDPDKSVVESPVDLQLKHFYLGTNLIVLNFRRNALRKAESIVVLPSQVGEKPFRQLKLILRYSRK